MSEESKISLDPAVMEGFTGTLQGIDGQLETACTEASTLKEDFEGAYEGEAKEEVSLFLEYLPTHLERLRTIYQKLKEYIAVTSESFTHNDSTMTGKMEGGE